MARGNSGNNNGPLTRSQAVNTFVNANRRPTAPTPAAASAKPVTTPAGLMPSRADGNMTAAQHAEASRNFSRAAAQHAGLAAAKARDAQRQKPKSQRAR
jgi:hypothetical protein